MNLEEMSDVKLRWVMTVLIPYLLEKRGFKVSGYQKVEGLE